jgi:hypothetical protein
VEQNNPVNIRTALRGFSFALVNHVNHVQWQIRLVQIIVPTVVSIAQWHATQKMSNTTSSRQQSIHMLSAFYLILYHSPVDTAHPSVNKAILYLTPTDAAHPDVQMSTR